MSITTKEIKQVVVFQSATENELQLILKNSIIRSIEENEFFFIQGEAAQYLYILTSGQIKLMQATRWWTWAQGQVTMPL